MSDAMICGECGQLKPRQRLHCVKHDVVYDPDKHCDHCENEIAEKFLSDVEKQLDAEANDNAT